MKLLIDMNLSPNWADVLQRAGMEAAHWSSIGPPDAPDSAIMSYAKVRGYVVLTHDLDFSAILAASGGERPSVVQLRADDIRPAAIGTLVVDALKQSERELRAGALLTIDADRRRLRMLPLLIR